MKEPISILKSSSLDKSWGHFEWKWCFDNTFVPRHSICFCSLTVYCMFTLLLQIWTAPRKEGQMTVLLRRKAGLGMLLTHAQSRRPMETPRMSSSWPGVPLLMNGLESALDLRTQITAGVRAHWVAPHPSIVPLWNFSDWMEVHSRPRTHSLLWYHHCMVRQHLVPWANPSAATYGAS